MLSDFGCGTLTWVVSTQAFSHVCQFIGDPLDYARLCLVSRRIRNDCLMFANHVTVDVMMSQLLPLRRIQSIKVSNVALWHFGREDFQDGLILFLPPPGATEIDPDTHPLVMANEAVHPTALTLCNTVDVDYDSNGATQKFRFTTAWLPTPLSAFNYFANLVSLELHDFYSAAEWYLGFLDPLNGFGGSRGSTAPSTPNSTFSDSMDWSPLPWNSPPPMAIKAGKGALLDLEVLRLVNCRTSIEDIKQVVSTPRGARSLVVIETIRGSGIHGFSAENSPRRRTRVSARKKKKHAQPPELTGVWDVFTTSVEIARCTTQQLDEILTVGVFLRTLVVRSLAVLDQSSLEASCHERLQSLTLHCTPDSSVRETSIDLPLDCFPSLTSCGIHGGPVTGLARSESLKLLVLQGCEIDIREQVTVLNAEVRIIGCKLYSPLSLVSRSCIQENVSGDVKFDSSLHCDSAKLLPRSDTGDGDASFSSNTLGEEPTVLSRFRPLFRDRGSPT